MYNSGFGGMPTSQSSSSSMQPNSMNNNNNMNAGPALPFQGLPPLGAAGNAVANMGLEYSMQLYNRNVT